jgi:hypothetical protein
LVGLLQLGGMAILEDAGTTTFANYLVVDFNGLSSVTMFFVTNLLRR